jgi:hypothetical protein
MKNPFWNAYQYLNCFVICNKLATTRSIEVFNRLQHARYEHHFVVASVNETSLYLTGIIAWLAVH